MSPEETSEMGGRMTLMQIILPYLKIQLVPLSAFLIQNIKSFIVIANEQANQKSSLFWCPELKRADSFVSTDFAFTVKRNSLFA